MILLCSLDSLNFSSGVLARERVYRAQVQGGSCGRDRASDSGTNRAREERRESRRETEATDAYKGIVAATSILDQ